MTEPEIILSLLSQKKMTQGEIFHSMKGNEHKSYDTALRHIRQVIRDLRFQGHKILSDDSGYWIPKPENEEREAKEYIERMERTAKAQSRAWMTTYNQMKKILNVSSEYFEGTAKLF